MVHTSFNMPNEWTAFEQPPPTSTTSTDLTCSLGLSNRQLKIAQFSFPIRQKHRDCASWEQCAWLRGPNRHGPRPGPVPVPGDTVPARPGRAQHERSWKSCASLLLAHIQPIRVANSGVSIQRMFHMVTGEQEIQQPFTTFLHEVESVIGWESAASARLVCACVRLYLCGQLEIGTVRVERETERVRVRASNIEKSCQIRYEHTYKDTTAGHHTSLSLTGARASSCSLRNNKHFY